MRHGLDTLIEDQPLVVGAIAMALGAAVGGALPRSRVEDRMFGEQSDRAMETVRTLAKDQGAKVQATASAVVDEALNIADEASAELGAKLPSGEEIVDAAESKVREAASRLREASGVEAKPGARATARQARTVPGRRGWPSSQPRRGPEGRPLPIHRCGHPTPFAGANSERMDMRHAYLSYAFGWRSVADCDLASRIRNSSTALHHRNTWKQKKVTRHLLYASLPLLRGGTRRSRAPSRCAVSVPGPLAISCCSITTICSTEWSASWWSSRSRQASLVGLARCRPSR